jgi:AcrR family transcriptional regulator
MATKSKNKTNEPIRPHRRAKGEGGQTRSDILKAASELLEQEGRKGTTIRAIAEKVGISSTALYFHFDDVDAILFEICDAIYSGLAARFHRDALRCKDPIQRVEAMMRSYLLFGLSNRQAYVLTFMEPQKGHQSTGVKGKTPQAELATVLFWQAVQAALVSVGRDPKEGEKLAKLIWFAVHGVVTMAIARPENFSVSPEKLSKEMVQLLIKGSLEP